MFLMGQITKEISPARADPTPETQLPCHLIPECQRVGQPFQPLVSPMPRMTFTSSTTKDKRSPQDESDCHHNTKMLARAIMCCRRYLRTL